MPGLLSDDEEERAIRAQAGFGGLLSLGAGLMGYGADTRNPQPLMQGVMGFQDALRGAIEARYQNERMKQIRAQTSLAEANAAKIQAQQQADARFTDRLAGAPGTGQVAQGDAQQPLDLTDQEKQYLLTIPDAKERGEAFRRLQERKLIDRMPAQGYRSNPDGSQAFITGGPADPKVRAQLAEAQRQADAKAIPTKVTSGLTENLSAIQEIDRALEALKSNPDAVGGLWNSATTVFGPASALQRNFGTEATAKTQALVAGVGGQKLHDMSGAAVTLAEDTRLAPLIPKISDDAPTAAVKLRTLRQKYQDQIDMTIGYYNAPGSGYRPFEIGKTPAQQEQQQAPSGAPVPGSAPRIRRYNPETGKIE